MFVLSVRVDVVVEDVLMVVLVGLELFLFSLFPLSLWMLNGGDSDGEVVDD